MLFYRDMGDTFATDGLYHTLSSGFCTKSVRDFPFFPTKATSAFRSVHLYLITLIIFQRRLWSRGSVLVFSTQVRGFKPGRSRRIFRAKKIFITPSFGGEVKPQVPCRTFAACERSINLRGSRNLGKITGHLSLPQFHLQLLGSLASLRTYRHLAAKVGTSKGGEKQWQTTPKNRKFIGPCIIVIVEELKTNLLSLVVFTSLIFAQHVSNINMSTFRSLRHS